MRWGRPFDPDAEAIWVAGAVTGATGDIRDLLLLGDPGTPETIIDEEVATELGLGRSKAIGTGRFKGFTGPENVYYVIAPEFASLGRSLHEVVIACSPFDPDFEIDGLLGLDFFRNTVVTLDFKQGRILLED
ncbi:MAG: retropepsin-like domain-containing protein [Candidatus Riflebacteria bacterium]|nr:retropepsin-like domain-containing protein [Candidatus Riflebacteria bacterium]